MGGRGDGSRSAIGSRVLAANSIKKVPLDRVRLGMFIHDIGVSWISHSFWRSRFALTSPDDLARLRSLDVPAIWIDTSLGLDVDDDDAEGMDQAAETTDIGSSLPTIEATVLVDDPVGDDPVGEASALCDRARGVMLRMFHDARLGRLVDLDVATALVDEMTHSIARHPSALLSLVRLKSADDYTYVHSVAVGALMVAFARHMGLSASLVRSAGRAGLLHDVGKARVPLAVLNKPAALSVSEMTLMRMHPSEGHRILAKNGADDQDTLDACLHHHEKFDGSGYPHKLAGESIALLARMTSICDVYDAVTSDRPYKRGWDPAYALQKMATWQGHFDPRLFRAFVRTIGIYPIGALVRLSSGHLAVVVDGARHSLTEPCVRVFYDIEPRVHVDPYVLDLADAATSVRILAKEDPTQWPVANLGRLAVP